MVVPRRVRLIRRIVQRLPRAKRVGIALARRLIGDRCLIPLEEGLLIEVDLNDYVGRYLFIFGVEEPPWTIARDGVQPGEIVFDVGANIGAFTLLAAKRGAHVHAFEPDPANYEALVSNIKRNDLAVSTEQMAIGDSTGTASFDRPPSENSGLGRLTEKGIPVRIETLDNYCGRRGVFPDLLKVDVEGAETLVLSGARKLLSTRGAPTLIIESNAETLERFGSSTEVLQSVLASHGYRTFAIGGDLLAVRDERKAQFQRFVSDERLPVGGDR
jgi:FkbM family methyltransferase